MKLWLVGVGPHAIEYAKVLKKLNVDFEAIGRGVESCKNFTLMTEKAAHSGGISSAINLLGPPEIAIISVSFDQLSNVAIALIKAGTKKILLEKPGGLNILEINKLHEIAKAFNASVYIAYNRRFYSSTTYVMDRIKEDGGVTSCIFEFTEWAHTIAPWQVPVKVKEALIFANSSHVIDLAFYICGKPLEWKSWCQGKIFWHPSAARFAGAGVTEDGVLFSYHADWEAPGRWGLEILTRKHRFILRPMEKLFVTEIGSIAVNQVELNDNLDIEFKPGLYKQTQAFLEGKTDEFCTLEEQYQMAPIYSKIAGY